MPGTEALASLFTADATYLQSPYEQPVTGIEAIKQMWKDEPEGPGEDFTLVTDIIAVDGRTAVVRAEVGYGDPPRQKYRDLWVIRLADDGVATGSRSGLTGPSAPTPSPVTCPSRSRRHTLSRGPDEGSEGQGAVFDACQADARRPSARAAR